MRELKIDGLVAFTRELIGSGRLGIVLNVRIRVQAKNADSFGFGMEALCSLLGRPVSCLCMFAEPASRPYESAVAAYRYRSGAIGVVEIAPPSPSFHNCFECHGTQGSVVDTPLGVRYRFVDSDWMAVPEGGLLSATERKNRANSSSPDADDSEAADIAAMLSAAYAAQGREYILGENL